MIKSCVKLGKKKFISLDISFYVRINLKCVITFEIYYKDNL